MNEATITFVRQHADDDVRQLALYAKHGEDVDLKAALQQIQGRQTARKKLPTWAACDAILYPPHLSMEQCSSEQTARYKATVVAKLLQPAIDTIETIETIETMASIASMPSPQESTLIDLTGGFGVDFSFMAPLFTKAVYVERQEALCRLARHNLHALGLHHTEVVCADSEAYLDTIPSPIKTEQAPFTYTSKSNQAPLPSGGAGGGFFPSGGAGGGSQGGSQRYGTRIFFLDPARRNEQGGRTYGISDCTPDVLALRDELLRKADYVVLKLSPMLDWRKTVDDLGRNHVSQVHIVATGNEVKELLVVLQSQADALTVTCENDGTRFSTTIETIEAIDAIEAIETIETIEAIEAIEAIDAIETIGSIKSMASFPYLYEPNAAIMKGGFFAELSARYGVNQIAQNSHLFVSEQRVEGFPGREFRIKAVTTMNKKELKKALQGIAQANITVRNFPLSVAELRKRLKISEGGSTYIFATTLAHGEHLLFICEK